MTPPTRRKLLLAALCVLFVVVARSWLSLLLIHDGFRALSDDDYSRVVIAQQFASDPALDPSKTSWLPFPFWLYGTVMMGFGSSLDTARALGFALGLLSSSLVWVAARWLGLSRATSTVGALICMSVPYSALLGLATTPDVYTAALTVLACASLTRKKLLLRTFGATALVAASLSRYEAWPIAALWGLFSVRDAVRLREVRFALLALTVLAAPTLWVLHGAQIHGAPLFFVERVTSYHQALGSGDRDGFARGLKTLWRLFADAPELWALVIAISTISQLRGVRFWQGRWARPSWCMLLLVLFIGIGGSKGSTATHNTGRTLLAVWNLLSLMSAAGLAALTQATVHRTRARVLAGTLGGIAVAAMIIRARATCSVLPQARSEEVAMGLLAATHIPNGQHLAIHTPDYGYFAVQAAFGRPFQARILDTHDPRNRSGSALDSSSAVRRALERVSARWIVTDRAHEHLLEPFAIVLHRGPTLVFAQVR